MKKFLGLMVLVAAFSISVQAANANEPVYGLFYKNATEAGSGFSNAAAAKKELQYVKVTLGLLDLEIAALMKPQKMEKLKM